MKERTVKVVESNSGIKDLPTAYDFMPTTMYRESEYHTLGYTPGGPLRVWTCFNPFIIGKTADDKHSIIFHWGFLFPDPGRVEAAVPLYLDYRPVNGVVFKAPVYYDKEKKLYPHPTIYIFGERKKDGVKYVESLSYNEPEREWIIVIKPAGSEEGWSFESRTKCRGIPLWFGKPDGPYTFFGIYPNIKDVDVWSSCWDTGVCKGNLTVPGLGTYPFSGPFINVRSIHFAYYGTPELAGWAHSLPLLGQYGFLQQDDLTLKFGYCPNPIPEHLPEFKPLRSGRIDLHSKGKYSVFDNFNYSDSGGPIPSKFHLWGEYERGKVDLTGEPYVHFPKEDNEWIRPTEIWWEKGAKRNASWGRTFNRWTGEITCDGETIKVENAQGFIEHFRLEGYPPWSK